MATAITVLAAVSVTTGGAVALLRFGWPNELPPTTEIAGGIVTVLVGYYLAGLVDGTAWFVLQRLSHLYVGQVLVAFVLGGIIYGAVGLSGTVAYVRFGINLLDFKSPTSAWQSLPIMTLALATFTAIIGVPAVLALAHLVSVGNMAHHPRQRSSSASTAASCRATKRAPPLTVRSVVPAAPRNIAVLGRPSVCCIVGTDPARSPRAGHRQALEEVL